MEAANLDSPHRFTVGRCPGPDGNGQTGTAIDQRCARTSLVRPEST
jgi:hypothetical protein